MKTKELVEELEYSDLTDYVFKSSGNYVYLEPEIREEIIRRLWELDGLNEESRHQGIERDLNT